MESWNPMSITPKKQGEYLCFYIKKDAYGNASNGDYHYTSVIFDCEWNWDPVDGILLAWCEFNRQDEIMQAINQSELPLNKIEGVVNIDPVDCQVLHVQTDKSESEFDLSDNEFIEELFKDITPLHEQCKFKIILEYV